MIISTRLNQEQGTRNEERVGLIENACFEIGFAASTHTHTILERLLILQATSAGTSNKFQISCLSLVTCRLPSSSSSNPPTDFLVSPYTSLHIYFRQIRLGLALAMSRPKAVFLHSFSSFSLTLTTSVDIAHTPRRTMANTQLPLPAEENRRQYENMKMITDNLLKRSSVVSLHVPLANHRDPREWERQRERGQFLACNTKYNRVHSGARAYSKSNFYCHINCIAKLLPLTHCATAWAHDYDYHYYDLSIPSQCVL